MFAYREFLVELVGQQGVWQLPEVELTQRAHTVDILDVDIFGQVGDLFRVELVPDETGRGQVPSRAWKFDQMTANESLFNRYFKLCCQKYILIKGPIKPMNANM